MLGCGSRQVSAFARERQIDTDVLCDGQKEVVTESCVVLPSIPASINNQRSCHLPEVGERPGQVDHLQPNTSGILLTQDLGQAEQQLAEPQGLSAALRTQTSTKT